MGHSHSLRKTILYTLISPFVKYTLFLVKKQFRKEYENPQII